MNQRTGIRTTNRFLLIMFVITAQHLTFLGCSHDNLVQSVDETEFTAGYQERYYEGMRYGLFVPLSYDSTKTYPLVVSLHGSTDTVSWDLSWYHDPIQSTDPCFVMTPKSLVRGNGWGTSWTPEHSTDMKKTLAVIDLLTARFRLDMNRLYIYGVSMGGFGVFSVLTKEPGMFAAAFSICGGGNPATAGFLVQTPLWIFHGSNDNVVPVTQSRDMHHAILAAGGRQVRYTEYPGVDHAAWVPAWQEPTLEWWLLAQEKGVTHGLPDSVENFRYEMVQSSQVTLLWDPPANQANPDNQVWYYKVFRDYVMIGKVDNIETSFVDSGVSGSSTHLYCVSAVSYFFRESLLTYPLSIKFYNANKPSKARLSKSLAFRRPQPGSLLTAN